MDILLILGNVTKDQADPLVRAMYQRGLTPRIHRIADAPRPDFFIKAYDERERALADTPRGDMPFGDPWIDARVDGLQKESLDSAMKDVLFENVKAILFQEGASIDDDWSWVTKELHVDTPCYRVERSESDGSQYLIGRGFGEVLDIEK